MADHFGGVVPTQDNSRSETRTIYGAIITVTILATIAVIFRFVARRKSEASISYGTYILKMIQPLGTEIESYTASKFTFPTLETCLSTRLSNLRSNTDLKICVDDYSIVLALVNYSPLSLVHTFETSL